MKITQKLLSVLIAAFFLFGTVPGVPLGTQNANAVTVPEITVASSYDPILCEVAVTISCSGNDMPAAYTYAIKDSAGIVIKTDSFQLKADKSINVVGPGLAFPAPNTIYHYGIDITDDKGTTRKYNQEYCTLAAISGCVFADLNYNGVMDAGEPGVGGVTVTLADSNVTTTTTANGQYMFKNLPADTGYTVSILDLAGYINTTPRPLAVNIIPGTGIVQNVNFGIAAPKSPAVTTEGVSGMSATSAFLNGKVNAFGFSNTAVSFEYGTDNAYGTTVTAAESPVNGINDTPVSASISGLNPNTTYHYRAVGINSKGTTCGDDLTFTTPASQTPAPSDEYSPSSNTYSAPATVTAQPSSTSAVVTPPDATMIPAEHSATFTLDETTYFIDGEAHEMDTVPFAQGERVLIPQRYLGIALGIPDDATHMIWDEATKTATFITADGKEAKCSVGSKILTFDGREIQMDVEPIVQDGHIFLPARFLTEALGGSVSWNDLAKTVTVKITR